MSDYPHDRRGVWALDFLKVLHRAQLAMELGAGGVCLIAEVALAEHARDYMSPPNFWNNQLKDACGFSDEEAFNALRKRCVKAGWLVYDRGGFPGAAGRYWVRVPTELAGMMTRIPVKPVSDPGEDPGKHPGKHPGKDPGASTPSPSLPSPHPPTHTGSGVGVGGCDPYLKQKATRHRIEAVLSELLVSTGPKATGNWLAAIRLNHRITTLAAAETCLREVIEGRRAAGETINYASEVADSIRRWKPAEAQP